MDGTGGHRLSLLSSLSSSSLSSSSFVYLSSPLTGYSSPSLVTSCYASIVVTVVVIAVILPPKHGDWDWQLQVKEMQK